MRWRQKEIAREEERDRESESEIEVVSTVRKRERGREENNSQLDRARGRQRENILVSRDFNINTITTLQPIRCEETPQDSISC